MVTNARPNGREPRWTGARLWVYTVPGGVAPCSIIVRTVGTGRQNDTLYAREGIPMEPGSIQSRNPEYALGLALHACMAPALWLELIETIRRA